MPVTGEKAAWTPCHAPLEVPQKVDQKGAMDSFSTGVSCSWTCTCRKCFASLRQTAGQVSHALWLKLQGIAGATHARPREPLSITGLRFDVTCQKSTVCQCIAQGQVQEH